MNGLANPGDEVELSYAVTLNATGTWRNAACVASVDFVDNHSEDCFTAPVNAQRHRRNGDADIHSDANIHGDRNGVTTPRRPPPALARASLPGRLPRQHWPCS